MWVLSMVIVECGCLFYVGNSLYKKTTSINWYSQAHIEESRKKMIYLVILACFVMVVDMAGLAFMTIAYFGPNVNDQVSWARLALYMLPIHYFLIWIYFLGVTDLGFSTPNRSSIQVSATRASSIQRQILKI